MKLLIYGTGGLAKEVYDIVVRSTPTKYEHIYFIDDFVEEGVFYLSESVHFRSLPTKFESNFHELEGVVAVGEPSIREKLTAKFDMLGINLATVVDRTSIISPTAFIEKGSIICEYTTIHANVTVGRGCLIQPYVDLGHDVKIGDYSVISTTCTPGGSNVFGKRVYMGMNSSTKQNITVGDDAIIGMGSVVFSNVEAGYTVVGNPARVTKGNDQHKVFKHSRKPEPIVDIKD